MCRTLALLIIGIILGAIITNTIAGKQLDHLYLENERLKINLYETAQRLEKIRSQWETYRPDIVQEVKIKLDMENNPFVEVALHQTITKITQEIVGEEIDSLSPLLIRNLLHNRIIHVEEAGGDNYHLEVQSVIISTKVIYYIHAIPLSNNMPSNMSSAN